MKTLLLLILFSTISLSFGQQSPDPVRDTDGNLLRSGTEYYILPVFQGMGGGLTLASTRNESCPLDVVQADLEIDNGLPLTFTPVDPKKGVIRESKNLNIIFSTSAICSQSNVWMLEEYAGSQIVTAHGSVGNAGDQESINNSFKIEKYDDGYKIVFCPTVCEDGDIGIEITENERRRLAINDVPFNIMFKKA